ncbi:hypothetical protein RJ639_047535, partial [Escallonia herrerae]
MITEEVNATVPDVINTFSLNIKVREYYVRYFWIHNTGPIGCLAFILTGVRLTPDQIDGAGCAKLFNDVAQHFNRKLKGQVVVLRAQLPLAAITYVDIYIPSNTLSSANLNNMKGKERVYGEATALAAVVLWGDLGGSSSVVVRGYKGQWKSGGTMTYDFSRNSFISKSSKSLLLFHSSTTHHPIRDTTAAAAIVDEIENKSLIREGKKISAASADAMADDMRSSVVETTGGGTSSSLPPKPDKKRSPRRRQCDNQSAMDLAKNQ